MDLLRHQWEPLALSLKALLARSGLHASPERTADISSILRPPGSTHRKGEPVQVVCGPLVGPYPLERFDGLLEIERGLGKPSTLVVDRNVYGGIHGRVPNRGSFDNPPGGDPVRPKILPVGRVDGLRVRLGLSLGNIHAPEPIDFDALCRGCYQMRALRELHGNRPEPIWYASLGVLSFCGEGDEIAHLWSSGHPTYSREETSARLLRARAMGGPTTCAHFRSLDPQGCEGCKFGQSTPLQAARESRAAAEHVHVGEIITPTEKTRPPPDGQVLPNTNEYELIGGALFHTADPKKDGDKPARTKLTSFSIAVQSVHVGEIKDRQNYYLLRHYKPHAGWQDAELKASQMHGPQMLATMADLGVIVHDASLFGKYIRDSIDVLHAREKAQMQFEQYGWKDNDQSFLWGERLFTAAGPKPTALSPELRFRAQWLRPALGGSLAAWKGAVDNLMGKGSEGMSFIVLASFAAPLMRFLESNEGGAMVHLVTRHSGAGKTTSLAGAYTVWASSDRGLGLTTIDTKVSKAVTLGALANLPIVYDEFQNKDPSVIREFAVMFTSGRDKMRADSSGHLIHNAASWQTLLLSAANQSLVDTIMSTGESDAPAMRVLEMPVESSGNLSMSEAMGLKKQLESNGGHAGEAYLSYLVKPEVLAWVKAKLPELMDEIAAKGRFQKEHRFWVRTLAATACAALIVEKMGLVSFSPARIMDWAIAHFSRVGAAAPQADNSMLTYLSMFLNEHLDETLAMPGPQKGRAAMPHIGDKPKRRVVVRTEMDGETTYISERALRAWLETRAGGGYTTLLQELKLKGVLKADHKMLTLSAGTDLHSGPVYVMGFDCGHPAFTGLVRSIKTVKEEFRSERVRGRLERVK